MQKLTVDAGFTCPNRDGTLSTGGCIYCNNLSFSPGAGSRASVTEQLEQSRRFFARKYADMRYLAYFQSYTGSYGELSHLLALYDEALEVEGVDGFIIGTRPDCMPDELLAALADRFRCRFVMIEYGAESSHDRTLRLINRCHTWDDTADAVRRTHAAGLPVGIHLIMGLPGESEADMLATVDAVNTLPVDVVKFHQLQVVRGTRLHAMIERGEIEVPEMTVDSYIELCVKIVSRLRDDIVIERFVSQSPDGMLVSPRWGLKNYEFTERLRKRLSSGHL